MPELLTLDAFREAQAAHSRRGRAYAAVHLPIPGAAGEVYVKAEGLQPIGSFKLRGAYNKIAQLTDAERKRGVITYSSGNHAQGVAYAAQSGGSKGGNRDAIKRSRGETPGHCRSRRGDRDGRPVELRAEEKSRAA